MKRINILFIFIFSVPSATFSQQSDLLEKYRSMAVEYNHDLKAADKHISASIELEKAARKDLRPKLSGDANFQYTGNPIQLTLDLPSMQNPLTFEGKDMKYGASLTLLQPVYTGGRLLETIRMAKHQHSLAAHQAEYFRSALCYQTDMQYWNTVARAELLQVATDYRNSIASLTKTIRERVEAGLVDPQDLLMAEVKLNEAEYQLLQAKSSLETGRMALNYMQNWGDKYPPAFLVDNNSEIHGQERWGIPVKSPDEILKVPESERNVWICNMYYDAIGAQLDSMGVEYRCYWDHYYM